MREALAYSIGRPQDREQRVDHYDTATTFPHHSLHRQIRTRFETWHTAAALEDEHELTGRIGNRTFDAGYPRAGLHAHGTYAA